MNKPIPRPRMSRTDFACMTLCYAIIGSLAWALCTLDVVPLVITAGLSALAIALSGVVK